MNKLLRSAEKDRAKAREVYLHARDHGHRGQRKAWLELRDKTTKALEVYADLICDAGPLFRGKAA